MNAFDALDLPRRLALAADAVDAAFREAGKTHHPDAGGDEHHFARLREARSTLTSPAARLAHWLEIQGHQPDPRGTIAPEIMDLFSAVGDAVQAAGAITRRRAAATTALGLALLEGETLASRDHLETMITTIDAAIASQCAPFPQWDVSPPDPAAAAATLRNLRFLEKWKTTLMAAYSGLA